MTPDLRPAAILLGCALLAAGCRSGDSETYPRANVTTPDPTGVAPAALIDLSHWYLTLPVDAAGGTTGEAASVETDTLLAGYDSEWFYAAQFGGEEGITFWAPVNGARTLRALHARSELRELLSPPDRAVNWLATGPARLDARLIVHQVPVENGKVTVGQIVGYDRDNPEVSRLVRVIFEHNLNGEAKLYALVFDSPDASNSSGRTLPITSAVRLSEPFSYTLDVVDNTLTVTSGASTVSTPIHVNWTGVGLYFRAGAQVHASGLSATDGARVTFYDLAVTH